MDGDREVGMVAEMAQVTEPKGILTSVANISQNLRVCGINCGQKDFPEMLRAARAFGSQYNRMLPKGIQAAGSLCLRGPCCTERVLSRGPGTVMHGKSCHRKDSSADDVHKSPHSPMPLSCNPSEVVRVQMFDGENVARPRDLLMA